MPAWAAELFVTKAREATTEMLSIVIPELRTRQRQGEQRAIQGAGRRRAAQLKRDRTRSGVVVDTAERAAPPAVIRNVDDLRRWREAKGLD
jgi:hypothetical protein